MRNDLYTAFSQAQTDPEYLSQITLTRMSGDGSYTDTLMLSFETVSGGCLVEACSESQVESFVDFSTNYCNLHDLYCSDQSCQGAKGLTYIEKFVDCTQHEINACYEPNEVVATESASLEHSSAAEESGWSKKLVEACSMALVPLGATMLLLYHRRRASGPQHGHAQTPAAIQGSSTTL
jgi:hypothetical protein